MEKNGYYKVLHFIRKKVHNLLHMLQPALAWEQVKVLVYYIKLHKRWGKKNVITISYVHNRSFELPLLSEVGISVSGLRLVIHIH